MNIVHTFSGEIEFQTRQDRSLQIGRLHLCYVEVLHGWNTPTAMHVLVILVRYSINLQNA